MDTKERKINKKYQTAIRTPYHKPPSLILVDNKKTSFKRGRQLDWHPSIYTPFFIPPKKLETAAADNKIN